MKDNSKGICLIYNSQKDDYPPFENLFHLQANEATLLFNQEQWKFLLEKELFKVCRILTRFNRKRGLN